MAGVKTADEGLPKKFYWIPVILAAIGLFVFLAGRDWSFLKVGPNVNFHKPAMEINLGDKTKFPDGKTSMMIYKNEFSYIVSWPSDRKLVTGKKNGDLKTAVFQKDGTLVGVLDSTKDDSPNVSIGEGDKLSFSGYDGVLSLSLE
ncbi:MAG: hypothetical protein PHP03_02815 [Candidatus Pacebacteria bacterium]|nr:hypothetical protein [Candidatus Paceibacterota bacterium]